MKGYNLYYKNSKINKRELTEEQVTNILSRGHVTRIEEYNHNGIIKKHRTIIPTKQITCISCTIV